MTDGQTDRRTDRWTDRRTDGQCDYYRAPPTSPSGALITKIYEGESISNQPIPFPMDRDSHDFHALFQYMFYMWVRNCTLIELFFNKILNVKHGW